MTTASRLPNQQSDTLLHGDCRSLLRTLAPNSVDLICTDPPYGIGFLGNAWDTAKDFQTLIHDASKECLRVLKPGAFMFVTMTPRQDSLARVLVAMEDAGFFMGFTSLYWTYTSGLPKSFHVGRRVDKRLGKERRIVGVHCMNDMRGGKYGRGKPKRTVLLRGGPVSPEAKRLEGAYSGFQPKPAVEVIVVAMKPLSKKGYIDEAIATGKGITWLDDARIPKESAVSVSRKNSARRGEGGRFPANLTVSGDALGSFSRFFSLDAWARDTLPFLVVPKAGEDERKLVAGRRRKRTGDHCAFDTYNRKRNGHPTVKPVTLMAYLITLGSRQGDVVLDPFLGSGTTAVAAKMLGRRYIGIEREREYLDIARRRVAAA